MTTRRTTLKKPALKLVQPDLAEMERVLVETAEQMAPMIRRVGSTRQKFEAEAKSLEAEREAVESRRALAQRHHEALMKGFEAELADINGALSFYAAGLTQNTLEAAE